MIIPIHTSFRGVIFASILIILLGGFVVKNNSKEKSEYEKTSGIIEFIGDEFQNLPARNNGDYKYIKIDSYPYVFEIYQAKSEKRFKSLSDLKKGDTVEIFFYETSDTQNSGINRFAQFVDSQNQAYYKRNGFQKQLGFVIIGLSILLIILGFFLWKKGKLNW